MQIFSLFRPLAVAILLYVASYLMLKGSGFFPEPNYFDVIILTLCLLLLIGSKKGFVWILMPICTIYALYSPIGLAFGPPSYQYVASLVATDLQESKEFLTLIPLSDYLALVGILLAVIFARKIAKSDKLHFHKNTAFTTLTAVLLFTTTAAYKFLHEGTTAIVQVKDELEKLNHLTIPSGWGDSTLENSQYDDYVLIIGESARRDYHHAYGYPVENTPFMSSAKGTLIDGLTSGGTYTISSLKLMLTKPNTQNWEGNYALNLVDLIKSAGIKTIWISNQGYLGSSDTPISSIANKSDESIFLKKGDSFSQNNSDFELLPPFENILARPTKEKRFIFLHLYGSHPVPCNRVSDYPKLFDETKIAKKYVNVNCYISSIKKTDALLGKIYQILSKHQKDTQRSFSMVYFSDHGLSHQISPDNIEIINRDKSKRHFDIPLFKISSDDTERHEYKVFKSGLNFIDGIANWIGIRNPKLNANADLFSNEPDPSDYGLQKLIEKIEMPLDPAIVIPK